MDAGTTGVGVTTGAGVAAVALPLPPPPPPQAAMRTDATMTSTRVGVARGNPALEYMFNFSSTDFRIISVII